MDYEKQEKEFYEIMRRERRKVESSDISENKKSRLYLLFDKVIEKFDEIIEKFKENTNYFERERAFESLNKILEGVCNPLKKPSLLEMISKKPNEKLREIVEKQLANKNILPFPNYIPPSNN